MKMAFEPFSVHVTVYPLFFSLELVGLTEHSSRPKTSPEPNIANFTIILELSFITLACFLSWNLAMGSTFIFSTKSEVCYCIWPGLDNSKAPS